MERKDLMEFSKSISLRDLKPGTVVEVLAAWEGESKHGEFVMADYRAEVVAEEGPRIGKMILPARFKEELKGEKGVPAVYVYYGKVAMKEDTSYHDLRRVPADPDHPYEPTFTTSHHADELRKKPAHELRSQLFTQSFTEIGEGTMPVLFDFQYVKTEKTARAPTVAYEASKEN